MTAIAMRKAESLLGGISGENVKTVGKAAGLLLATAAFVGLPATLAVAGTLALFNDQSQDALKNTGKAATGLMLGAVSVVGGAIGAGAKKVAEEVNLKQQTINEGEWKGLVGTLIGTGIMFGSMGLAATGILPGTAGLVFCVAGVTTMLASAIGSQNALSKGRDMNWRTRVNEEYAAKMEARIEGDAKNEQEPGKTGQEQEGGRILQGTFGERARRSTDDSPSRA